MDEYERKFKEDKRNFEMEKKLRELIIKSHFLEFTNKSMAKSKMIRKSS
jgi:hypothetical protein